MTGAASTMGSFGKSKVSSLFRNSLGKVLLESSPSSWLSNSPRVYMSHSVSPLAHHGHFIHP